MKNRKIKLSLVCTSGGHFEQMTNLSKFYDQYKHFWITHRNKQTLNQLINEHKYFINGAHYKKPWTYLKQISPVIEIFKKEKPTHILCTGSGRTALVPFLVAKIMRIKFLHIDTFSRVYGYSKFGSFLLAIRHKIFSQWEDKNNKHVEFIGPIFKPTDFSTTIKNHSHVFVAVGTRAEPFSRVVQAVENLVKNGFIKDKVIIQAGHTRYESNHVKIFDFCTPKEIDELIINAKYVITQEGAGIGTKCLKYRTKFIVMPREYGLGELPSKSDMNEDLHLKLEKLGYTKVVSSEPELKNAIKQLDKLKVGFVFDNSLAITTLTNLMETT